MGGGGVGYRSHLNNVLLTPQDFAAAGHTWTHALCMKDSDGDGRTNGEELGDPGCKWNVGDKPADVARGQPGNYTYRCILVIGHACRLVK